MKVQIEEIFGISFKKTRGSSTSDTIEGSYALLAIDK